MSFSPNDLAIYGLILVIGLCLGLMMSGSGKWKTRYRDMKTERDAALNERKALERERDIRIDAANKRIAELERDGRAGIGAGTAAAVAGGVRGADDLTLIAGIDRQREVQLNEAGISRFKQIAKLRADDELALEGRLGLPPRTIEQERWLEQADLLNRGKFEDHSAQFRSAHAV
ncbi:MAG: hypothetical protein U5M50_15570 [Sphingobium sp.]|nr:hypothetical protein [Sphingobium sp.]